MKKTLLLALLFALFTTVAFSQTDKFWSASSESRSGITTDKAVLRLTFPKEFKLFNLNIEPLRQELFSVVGNHPSKRSTVISLPNADGQFEQFEVFEASNFDPALQERFPEIRAYSGKGITDKYATLKLSISPQGIQTMVFRTDKANEFIEAYSQDHTIYAVFRSNRSAGQLPWTCSTPDQQMNTGLSAQIANTQRPESSAGQLKTMRLAQSVTAEYSNYFGATSVAQVGLVLAAINATLTRCNGCYEKDLAVHLNLIPNTTDVIYYNATTDPYANAATGAGGVWNGQLQSTLTSVIGEANYDIGHLFGASGGGGNAGCIGCVCVNGSKGSGFTSPADGIPQGDNFDIDYVVHEVGHQMGGNHTFTFQSEGGSLANSAQMEVASGITIMGYAGITNQDDSSHSIAFYHAVTIKQIQNNLATKTCPITTDITAVNATPVVAPVPNYTIPKSTPFALTASATDANPGDALTYSWEQMDPSTSLTGNNSVASQTKASGPNWLSFNATASPTRSFPRLSTILAGLNVTPTLAGGDPVANVEALSSVGRTLNFRVTVRDNSPYISTAPVSVGQTSYTDMVVTVNATAGPFAVTSPNTAVSWPALSTQDITWSVNGTDVAPISCTNVNIYLSIDGGLTWPITLATNTANDGTETLQIPNNPSTTARVKVESIGNVFFDISNTNFTISPLANAFAFSPTNPATISCGGPTTGNIILGTTASGGFSTPINLTAISGVPVGTTVSFSSNPLAPGSSTIVTLNNVNTLATGTYNITIQGVAGAVTQTAVLTYTVSPSAVLPTINIQPSQVPQTICNGIANTLSVSASGPVTYQWYSNTTASNTGGTLIPGATSSTYTPQTTTPGVLYYYCVVTGPCSTQGVASIPSGSVTVNLLPSITTQPSAVTACAGSNTSFTVVATGTGISYQWQSSPTGCAGAFTDMPGETSATLNLNAITVGMDGTAYHVVVSGTCAPPATSNCVVLTVGNAAAITADPVDITVCEGQNATFTVTTSGTINSYQWQENTGAGFVDMPGQTSASLTLNAVTVSMSGYQYRVNAFSCTAIPLTSAVATLTVNTLVTVSAQPTDVTLCAGANASFSVTAAGSGLTYQWQYAASCAGPFADIPTQTLATLNLNPATLANAGAYRVVVTGACNTITSNCAALVVNSPVTISAQPANVSICLPLSTASFGVTAAGTGLTYQWQVSTNGGTSFTDLAGQVSSSLTLLGITAGMNGYVYHVVLNGTCTTNLNSSNATLVVNSPVDIATQPQDTTSTCSGSPVSLHVDATGSTITYQWQVSINGGPFVDVTNTAPFSGATTATLNISSVSTALSGYVFQVIVSGVPCGAVTSDPALLIVNDLPVVVLTGASYPNINPYIRTTLYTTVSPPVSLPATYTYQWFRDGVLVPTLNNSDRFDVTVDDLGTYSVIVTNSATGCSSARSNTAKVDFAVSDQVFIYPNPSSGYFQVRYLSYTNNVGRTLNVYDSKGGRVYTKEYTTAGPYTKMDVYLDNAASDVYLVEIRDKDGKRLATGKVVIK